MSILKLYVKLLKKNERIVLIDCDLAKAFKSIKFKRHFPERYFNVGIAEQNAVSIAAGFASKGFFPIVQTFACFATEKCCDQIKNALAINKLPALIVGGKVGLSDGQGGVSHQAIEDYGLIASIPQTTIFSPITKDQIQYVLQSFVSIQGPSYLRLFDIDEYNSTYKLGVKWFSMFDESKNVFITTGDQLYNCIAARNELLINSKDVAIIYVNQLKPICSELVEFCRKFDVCITVETHNLINGFGSRINQELKHVGLKQLTQIAIKDCYSESGTYKELCHDLGIDIDAIIKTLHD